MFDQKLEALSDHELTSKYKPSFAGMGGEQVVFDIEGHPDVVAKVHKHRLGRILDYNLTEGAPPDAMKQRLRRHMEERLKQERERFVELRAYFGREHVLPERQYLQTVPVTDELLHAIHERGTTELSLPEGVHDVWTVLRIQKRLPEAALGEDALSIKFRYAESDYGLEAEELEAMNAQLLDDPKEATFADMDLMMFGNNEKALVNALKEDEGLRDTVGSFVKDAMRFTRETGEMLDLAGELNAALYKKDGAWTYVLADAFYPGQEYEKGIEAFRKLVAGEELDDWQASPLLNAMNYARLLNGLALALELDVEPLVFAEVPTAPHAEKVLKALRSILS